MSHAWFINYGLSSNAPVDYSTSSTVRWKIIGNEMIKHVGKSESCMLSKLRIIFKRTRIYIIYYMFCRLNWVEVLKQSVGQIAVKWLRPSCAALAPGQRNS